VSATREALLVVLEVQPRLTQRRLLKLAASLLDAPSYSDLRHELNSLVVDGVVSNGRDHGSSLYSLGGAA